MHAMQHLITHLLLKYTNNNCIYKLHHNLKFLMNLKALHPWLKMKKLKRKRSVNKTNQSEMENEIKVSLKLLVDTKSKKVLFAEAGKDFVDFLFHIMSLPVGLVIKLLNGKGGMVGCLGSLYKSIESLNDDYLQPNFDKDAVLQAETRATDVPLLLLPNDNVAACMPASAAGISSMEYFLCNLCYWDGSGYVTDCKGAVCPKCGGKMCIKLKYFRNTGSENSTPSSSNGSSSGGYVKGVVTYMVMDDLQVTPMSTISGITLISKFRVKDVSALEEKEVRVGLDEGLAMLKASLETNTVLTTVFIP